MARGIDWDIVVIGGPITDYLARGERPPESGESVRVNCVPSARQLDPLKALSDWRADGTSSVLVQFPERRQTEPILKFSLCGKHRFPYLQDPGAQAGDLRCVELPFFDFVRQLDSTQCYCRIPERLKTQHRVTSLLHPPMILFNHVIQVLAGPDERLSG